MFRSVSSLTLAALVLITPVAAGAAEWTVDYGESRLGFETSVMGGGIEGEFGEWSAAITFDESDLENASAVVEIQTGSADTNDGTRDETLKGSDWFAASEHPTARFESTAFREVGENAYEIEGNLTIRGNTNPVVLPFELSETKDGVEATGALTIDRTDYEVGQGDFTTGSVVALDVTIRVDIKASPAQ